MNNQKGSNADKSPFRKTRERLGYSRAKASEKIDWLTPERLERIETGKLKMRPEEAKSLSEAYEAPELCNYYCSHECEIGLDYVPEVPLDDLSKVTLRMLSSINTLEADQKRLIEIASDGEIGSDEIKDFVRLQTELERLSVAIESLQLWTEKMIASGMINKLMYERIKEELQGGPGRENN